MILYVYNMYAMHVCHRIGIRTDQFSMIKFTSSPSTIHWGRSWRKRILKLWNTNFMGTLFGKHTKTNIKRLWKITIILYSQVNYKWQFSTVNCSFTGGYTMPYHMAPALSGTIAALSAKAALSVQAYQTWLQTGQCQRSQCQRSYWMAEACDWFAQSLDSNGYETNCLKFFWMCGPLVFSVRDRP